jgi:type VI secretion system protein ImpH
MDAPDRQTSGYLTFLRRAAEAPRSFSLFALVRGAAARRLDKPPVGASRLPSQDIIGLKQIPHVRYPAPTLDAIDLEAGKGTAEGFWLGLTGPMSPLPLHITEYAMLERRNGKKQPFGDFLHMLTERFLQLFYRAWAVSQPAVEADRPDADHFANYVGRLTGADEGANEDSAFPARARLHYAALFASRRSAGAIEGGMTHLLGMKTEVREFQPRWRNIEADDRTRLGVRHHRLGDAILGGKVLQASDCFEARITANDIGQFRRMQPAGDLFPVAAEALDAFTPSHLEWTMTLCLAQGRVAPVRLDGEHRLGWSSWVGSPDTDHMRRDVHLRRSAMKLKARKGLQ